MQFVAGHFDANDAPVLHTDPLLVTRLGHPVRGTGDSGQLHALVVPIPLTRRQYRKTNEERPAFLAKRQSQLDRPGHLIIDLDATDGPTHGQQLFSFDHGPRSPASVFPVVGFRRGDQV